MTISLEFRTYMANGVLLYNGRYNNENDFMALELIGGQVVFTVSLGKEKGSLSSTTSQVKSFISGGVNDGQWHLVRVVFNNKVSW